MATRNNSDGAEANSDAFKNIYSPQMAIALADDLGALIDAFDRDGFVAGVDPAHMASLEMKARVVWLADHIHAHLDLPYAEAAEALVTLIATEPTPDPDTSGWADLCLWPLTMFVQRHGLEHFEASMSALHTLTQSFTAEFAIRPFILRYPEATLERLEEWREDESAHVRRLVSEGTRPRLPWGLRLKPFIEDPTPVLALIEPLRDDPSLYVRRSVANNLNDIAKDHPARVVATCADYMEGANEARAWLVRHALRTLVKDGDRDALGLLGFDPEAPVTIKDLACAPTVAIGDKLPFSFTLEAASEDPLPVVIDYVVHLVRKNGSRNAKTFKLSTRTLPPNANVALERKHSFRRVTTRKYYPGLHQLDVLVNGVVRGSLEFELEA